jgi:hypothetical protein
VISIDEQVMARLRKHAVRVIDIFRQVRLGLTWHDLTWPDLA